MARQELAPAALLVARAVADHLPPGEAIVGCSGGADSMALALGAQWAAARAGDRIRAIVVDHGLQDGSADVAERTRQRLHSRGVEADIVKVTVRPSGDGVEAAAREARLSALTAQGLPVLLGHTLDDQAESVLLGLLRGSGTRSLAGMAPRRELLIRPLLGLRRDDTVAACQAWGIDWWHDPMNDDPAFARVRARRLLRELSEGLGRDVAPALARTALLARADADLLDSLAGIEAPDDESPSCRELSDLPDALRWRALHRWLGSRGSAAEQTHVFAVDQLVLAWRGQGGIHVPGGTVRRVDGRLHFIRGAGEVEPV